MRFRLLLSIYISLLPLMLTGQTLEPLPDDPRIKKGVVANGFTYYLVENDIRHGYADFYLVRKVGASHEEDSQVGFNTIIGEMGIEGTRNFPNNTLVTYLDELGLDSDSDFRSVYGHESSYFVLENVPVERGAGVIDSTLLILYNWAMSINLDEEEVECGKQYYKNGMALVLDGPGRCAIEHSAALYGTDTVSVEGSLHSLFPQIDSYRAKDLRSFYYKWFTPQRMAMVVVGDISPSELEGKIKTLFQALPKFIDEPDDHFHDSLDHTGPLISTASDREVLNGNLSISFTTPAVPEHLRKSAVPYIQEYMNTMMEFLFTERMVYGAQRSESNYHYLGIKYGPFMDSRVQEAFKLDFVVPASSVEGGLEEIMEVVQDVRKNGFSRQEFERARGYFFRDLNYMYDWRIFTPNTVYAQRAMDNFIQGKTLASIEMKKEYMDRVSSLVGVEQFNTYVSTFLRGGDNCIIRYTHPEGLQSPKVDRARLYAVVDSLLSHPAGRNAGEKSFGEFVPAPANLPGEILSEYNESATGTKVWNLSNGATVVFKKTQAEPNKFTFEAISRGGLTLMEAGNMARQYINDISQFTPAGKNSASQMYLHKKINNIRLERVFGLNTTSLKGSSYTSNLELFFQMVDAYFAPVEGGEGYFEKYRDMKREELVSRKHNPVCVLEDTLKTFVYHDSRYVTTPDIRTLEGVNYRSAVKYINERFANASNFYFVIVGDIDEMMLKDAVVRHIATLPSDLSYRENWINIPLYLKKHNQKKVMEMKMEYPRSFYSMTLVSFSPYSIVNRVEMDIASKILTNRVCREMKERGFPVRMESEWVRYPEEFVVHSILSVTKEYTGDFENALSETLYKLSSEGATRVEIQNAKKVLAVAHNRALKESTGYWCDELVNKFLYGEDQFVHYERLVEGASDEQINAALSKCIDESTNSILILKGVKDDTDNNSNR